MADLITTGGAAVTMTSIELVQFINNQREAGDAELAHSDFLKKVPKVLGEHAGNFSCMFDVSIGQGATRASPGYRFPKREACLMAMSYSYDLQAKVFDKMTALEAKANTFDPASLTRIDILKLAIESEEGRIKAEATVTAQAQTLALQAPKVAALDLIATRADGSTCITNAAKDLQVQPKRLFGWMQEHDWIYRRAGGSGFVAYQPRLKSGYLEHKITTIERSDGSSRMVESVLVTAKGMARLALDLSTWQGGVQ